MSAGGSGDYSEDAEKDWFITAEDFTSVPGNWSGPPGRWLPRGIHGRRRTRPGQQVRMGRLAGAASWATSTSSYSAHSVSSASPPADWSVSLSRSESASANAHNSGTELVSIDRVDCDGGGIDVCELSFTQSQTGGAVFPLPRGQSLQAATDDSGGSGHSVRAVARDHSSVSPRRPLPPQMPRAGSSEVGRAAPRRHAPPNSAAVRSLVLFTPQDHASLQQQHSEHWRMGSSLSTTQDTRCSSSAMTGSECCYVTDDLLLVHPSPSTAAAHPMHPEPPHSGPPTHGLQQEWPPRPPHNGQPQLEASARPPANGPQHQEGHAKPQSHGPQQHEFTAKPPANSAGAGYPPARKRGSRSERNENAR
eukprot:TRINITY_DN60891_c0_g1_i1.p1 TRINITY_DN60891_c0_g1~~TRINITY_DN60891_c0_g1_i1.p1  ORF type:complete len:389 (+),score=23.52 TRINITY_DN60891_c0_g1_i1:79-1167(+)